MKIKNKEEYIGEKTWIGDFFSSKDATARPFFIQYFIESGVSNSYYAIHYKS